MRGRAVVAAVAWGLLTAQAPAASDQDLPWSDQPARVDATLGVVTAAAVGSPDPRFGRFSVAKRSARREGRRRALELVHRFVDDELAKVAVRPVEAERVHRTVARAVQVVAVRPLVDGGAVVVVRVPLEALRGALTPLRGVAWAP